MSIASYAGEFTVSPIPLEMSMNYCSHKCAVCFANLNQPGRTLDVNKSINQIKNCHKGKGLTSHLLANGYPVLLSNRVDPFAKTNYRQTLSFLELFSQNGNKVSFQTRGGDGIDDALSLIDYKASWYISISQLDDKIRKRVEPGAPSIESRFELIEKLLSLGHKVSVGINPLLEEWLPADEFDKMLDKLQSLGVKDVWIEVLHLNAKQVANMSEKEKAAVGEDIITEAKKRNRNASYFMYCVEEARDRGFNVFSINQPYASDFFKGYHDTYEGKTLLTHQDFINYCFKKYPKGGEIKFQEYFDFMAKPYYEDRFTEADGFAYRIARNVYREVVTEPIRTLKGVLQFYWDNPDVSKSLAGNDLFSVAVYKEGKNLIEWQCKENGMLVYYFHAKPLAKWQHVLE